MFARSAEPLSLQDVRRVVLAAQGFNRPRLRRPARTADLASVIRALGLVQLDYVKVLIPAHYLIFYSRLGSYDRALFEKTVYGSPGFTEQWAHEASVIPVETWALLRHRMAAFRIRPYTFQAFIDANPGYGDWVLEEIRSRGPLNAAALDHPPHVERKIKDSWYGTIPRAALEMHFARGRLAVIHRDESMSRFFDLAARVLDANHIERVVEQREADRELLRIAARALGVARAADLADYFRMPLKTATPRIAELVEAGELIEVEVEPPFGRAYLDAGAAQPRPVTACTLLAPFDPLIWFRPRTLRLFGFHYRFEIFVPAGKRKHGAYVLPFLFNENLQARVDLKSDRSAGKLLIQGAYLEDGANQEAVSEALAAELRVMANWLGFERIATGRRGNLARALARRLS